MTSATIKYFLLRGDAGSLRTAEISGWTGKAVAAPRTELDDLLLREELDKAGVYFLFGTNPVSGSMYSQKTLNSQAQVLWHRLFMVAEPMG